MDIVSLIRSYVEGLLEAENRFIEHLDSFPELEKTVVELSNRMAAGFLGAVLTTADDLICESGIRKKEYTVQRKRMRTLISSVGDVTFTHTLYKDKQGQTKCLLDDQIRLPDRSRRELIFPGELSVRAVRHRSVPVPPFAAEAEFSVHGEEYFLLKTVWHVFPMDSRRWFPPSSSLFSHGHSRQ